VQHRELGQLEEQPLQVTKGKARAEATETFLAVHLDQAVAVAAQDVPDCHL
jgi:hypothetical protein